MLNRHLGSLAYFGLCAAFGFVQDSSQALLLFFSATSLHARSSDQPRLEQSNVRVVAVLWKQTPAQAAAGGPPHPLPCPQQAGKGCRDQQCWVTPKSRHRSVLQYRSETPRSHFHLPTVSGSWTLPLHLHGQDPKDNLGIRCLQAESLAVPALPFCPPSSFAFTNLFHKLSLLTKSHLWQALAHLILPLVVFLSSGQGCFLAASGAKMPIC